MPCDTVWLSVIVNTNLDILIVGRLLSRSTPGLGSMSWPILCSSQALWQCLWSCVLWSAWSFTCPWGLVKILTTGLLSHTVLRPQNQNSHICAAAAECWSFKFMLQGSTGHVEDWMSHLGVVLWLCLICAAQFIAVKSLLFFGLLKVNQDSVRFVGQTGSESKLHCAFVQTVQM